MTQNGSFLYIYIIIKRRRDAVNPLSLRNALFVFATIYGSYLIV